MLGHLRVVGYSHLLPEARNVWRDVTLEGFHPRMSVGQGTLPVAPLPIGMVPKASLSILGEASVMWLRIVNSHTQVTMTQRSLPRLWEANEEVLGKKTCSIEIVMWVVMETCAHCDKISLWMHDFISDGSGYEPLNRKRSSSLFASEIATQNDTSI